MSDYIRTWTGRKFYPLDPKPEDVSIEDIAHALSLQPRFTGHTGCHLSVAEHSLFVAQITPHINNGLWGLLHDASEAYLIDLPSPVKHDPRFEFYRIAEKRIQSAIMEYFNLPLIEPPGIKRADRVALVCEATFFMPEVFIEEDIADWEQPDDAEWTAYAVFRNTTDPTNIEDEFLETFEHLATIAA